MQSICTSAWKTVSRIPIRLENETEDFEDVPLVAFMYLVFTIFFCLFLFCFVCFLFFGLLLLLLLLFYFFLISRVLGPRHQILYDRNHRASFGMNLYDECIGTFLLQRTGTEDQSIFIHDTPRTQKACNLIAVPLQLQLTHTHTHTHTQQVQI